METNHQSSEQYPLNTALEEENQIIAEAKQLLYKRMTNRKYDQFTSPGAVRDYLHFHLAERKHEVFYCLFLDSQHRLLDDRELFRGTIDGCSVYPEKSLRLLWRSTQRQSYWLIITHQGLLSRVPQIGRSRIGLKTHWHWSMFECWITLWSAIKM